METYAAAKSLVENPRFLEQKQCSLDALSYDLLDPPIIDLIKAINKLPGCFTLQCCYGHFLYEGQDNPNNLDPLPDSNGIAKVEYRIAYIAFCAENSENGRRLLKKFKQVTNINPDNIHFLSADWFWERQVNSYALQVQASRFRNMDRATLSYQEALGIERTRNFFFQALRKLFL